MANTFEEIILEILKSMNTDIENEKEVKTNVITIIKELLNGNISIVPNEDNAHEYIKEYDKDKINSEIDKAIKKKDYTLEDYGEYIVNYIKLYNINNNNINNINLLEKINELKINNNLKEYLKKELNKGNIKALHGYIGDNLLNKYIKNMNSEYSYKK